MRLILSSLTLAFIFLASFLIQPAAAQHRRDNCAVAGRTSSLVLIDRTSPYSTEGESRQGERIAAGVDAIFASLQTGDRVSIATIERHRGVSVSVFNQCFPGCPPARQGQFRLPGSCPEATIERERRDFRRALYAAVVPLLENDREQPNSDITGTIFQAAGQHTYNRLYLYSDMLENSQVLPWRSHFSTRLPAENFALVQRSGFVPNLRGAQVQIVGFGLSHSPNQPPLTDSQDRNVREFWRLYFGAAGATVSYRGAITP